MFRLIQERSRIKFGINTLTEWKEKMWALADRSSPESLYQQMESISKSEYRRVFTSNFKRKIRSIKQFMSLFY